MPRLTAPNSTSQGLIRLGTPASVGVEELGPLADLVGTWIGSHGWELIAVPKGEKDFEPKVRPYVEIVTFEPIGAKVPNRGGPAGDLFIRGLFYQMRIADRETDEPLHLENGMWLYLPGQPQSIARQASIPHGDVFLALGNSSTSKEPDIPTVEGLPDPGPKAMHGYNEKYPREVEACTRPGATETFYPFSPNEVLKKANEELKEEEEEEGPEISSTTTLSVSTEDGGGIVNIPFVEQQAKTSAFSCTYWLETIKKGDEEVQQLQYSQQTNIEFLPKQGAPGLIMWPHINVNTLRKQ